MVYMYSYVHFFFFFGIFFSINTSTLVDAKRIPHGWEKNMNEIDITIRASNLIPDPPNPF